MGCIVDYLAILGHGGRRMASELDVGAWPTKHIAGFVVDKGRNLGVG